MKRLLTSMAAIALISGCATGYQSSGFAGGFSETQLSPNIYRVKFRGNGYTSKDRAGDFAMLRSAELTLESGYQFFSIMDSNADTRTSRTPVSYTTRYNGLGQLETTQQGGYAISKPSSEMTIIMHRDMPESGTAFDATFLVKSLKEKYSITQP